MNEPVKLRLALASFAAFALLGAGFAAAASGPTLPKAGNWETKDGAGFASRPRSSSKA